MSTADRLVDRVLLRALAAVPAPLVGRARTAGAGTPLLEAAAAVAFGPLAGKPVAVMRGPARGLRLHLDRRSLSWLTGHVEREVQAALASRLVHGDCVVDLGASIGFHSLLAARLVGPAGTVFAFEPDVGTAESLRRNAALNRIRNVSVVEAAVSHREGTAYLERPGEATARLVERRIQDAAEVRTTSVDAFLAGAGGRRPALVKIDVEGHERAVLTGMSTTLARARPVVIVEMHGDRSFLPLLEMAGYVVRVLEASASVDEAPWWAHVIALPVPT